MSRLSRLFIPAIIAGIFCQTAEAIPAFARKYNISCTTCHTPSFPKLKPFGDQYAGDGFTLTEYQSPRYFTETGDEKLSLIRNFPIAVRLDGYVQVKIDNTGAVDLSAPYLLKLLSGGEISDHLAYYFYFYMDEHGEVAGVEDAFLMYNNLFDTELDIYLGQFQVSDPLFKRELRLTFEDYHVYTSRIGLSDISMKYDKGIMLTYGLPTGTGLVFEIVNGNGLAEANAMNFFDKDRHKSYLGRISQDIKDFLSIGLVGYYGRENMTNDFETLTNRALFGGADATVSLSDKLEINMQYLYRQDSEVLASTASLIPINDVITHGVMGEIIYSPKGDQSDWYAVGLYNYVESDFDPADYHSATLHLGYLLRRNVRLSLEFTEVFTNPDDPYSRISLGFTSAF
ncbi:MAG: hypothetical protein R6U78_06475 [Bacteroidales bacterium]